MCENLWIDKTIRNLAYSTFLEYKDNYGPLLEMQTIFTEIKSDRNDVKICWSYKSMF